MGARGTSSGAPSRLMSSVNAGWSMRPWPTRVEGFVHETYARAETLASDFFRTSSTRALLEQALATRIAAKVATDAHLEPMRSSYQPRSRCVRPRPRIAGAIARCSARPSAVSPFTAMEKPNWSFARPSTSTRKTMRLAARA